MTGPDPQREAEPSEAAQGPLPGEMTGTGPRSEPQAGEAVAGAK
jgi:hypothetical protein